MVVEPGVYKHFKTGRLYSVLGTAINTSKDFQESGRWVVYQHVEDHGVPRSGPLFVRPVSEFSEEVYGRPTGPNHVYSGPRFIKV